MGSPCDNERLVRFRVDPTGVPFCVVQLSAGIVLAWHDALPPTVFPTPVYSISAGGTDEVFAMHSSHAQREGGKAADSLCRQLHVHDFHPGEQEHFTSL